MSNALKMKVEIWSDISCPFCYIGKKNYELAVSDFEQAPHLALEWHSYQLDPTIPREESERMDYYTFLQDKKGMNREQVDEMFENITAMGKRVGIQFNFEKVIIANTLDAHRLLHLAKSKGLSDISEEVLFKAHFTDGLDVGSHEVLSKLAKEIGISEKEVEKTLKSDSFSYEVNQDIREAANIGVRGVPFFVLNRKYGISGAQPVDAFKETLEKAFSEWRVEHPEIVLQVSEGNSCNIDGDCQ